MREPRILIVEDDQPVRAMMRMVSAERYATDAVANAEAALALAERQRYDVLVVDVRLPGISGLDLIPRITQRQPHIAVIVTSGEGTIDMAVTAMKRGALDFLSKPFGADALKTLLQVAVNPHRQSGSGQSHPRGSSTIVGESDDMRSVLSEVDLIAPFNTSVLITGETGTGKELIARRVHAMSPRANGPFIAINCAAIPESLLENELFGHVRGAFTGAQEQRAGRFEQADGGTLFLDEVADMPLAVQAKLLRVLQERQFEPLGAGRTTKVDVRVISATSADLRQAIAAGTFRADLYYRLNVVRLELPPLRERPSDIEPLARFLLAEFCAEAGLPPKQIAPGALAILMTYDWPGNARQLRNTMERAAVMSGRASIIEPADLPKEIGSAVMRMREVPVDDSSPDEPSDLARKTRTPLQFETVVRDFERRLLLDALERSGGNKVQAARLLGMKRTTFAARLQRVRSSES